MDDGLQPQRLDFENERLDPQGQANIWPMFQPAARKDGASLRLVLDARERLDS